MNCLDALEEPKESKSPIKGDRLIILAITVATLFFESDIEAPSINATPAKVQNTQSKKNLFFMLGLIWLLCNLMDKRSSYLLRRPLISLYLYILKHIRIVADSQSLAACCGHISQNDFAGFDIWEFLLV